MRLVRLQWGLALLLAIGCLGFGRLAHAAPPTSISYTVGVCDPNWPQRCEQGGPFVPDAVSLASLSVTNASGRVTLGGTGPTVLLWNNGATDISLKLGGSTVTAATTDFILGAGRAITFARLTNTYVAAITASSTSTLVVETGTGVPAMMAPGGGGSSGGAVTVTSGTLAATSTITTSTPTVTVTAGAYVAGNVIGGIISFTGQPTTGVVANADVTLDSGTFTGGSIDLYLFNASPTGGGTSDHAAFALTAADTAKVIGVLHLSDCTSLGGVLSQCQALYQSQFYTLAASGTTIFGVYVDRTAGVTFAGTGDFKVNLQVVK